MKILVVDDDEVTRKLLREVLEKQGFVVHLAASGEDAIRMVSESTYPVVVSDIRMAELDGMGVLKAVKSRSRDSAVILMTGFGSMGGAIEAIQQGAYDYISKPFKLDELKALVARAAKNWESMQQLSKSNVDSKKSAASATLADGPKLLIGKSPQIFEVFKTIGRVSMSSSTVLVIGESGTGKELVARAIHDNSPRRGKPFTAINCGALSESLLESELFGHVRGAFTGASSDKKGILEEASGGTLFLDEIGDVTPAMQVKLLRVLQEGEFKPVGSVETRKTDVRVVAATHRDLAQCVRSGAFREDLYYRLKVISIDLPPLRERMDDLRDLLDHFVAKYSNKNRKQVSHVSDEAMKILQAYSWPGNIRELEHAVEHAIAMTRTTILSAEDFPAALSRAESETTEVGHQGSLEDMEKVHILKVLSDVGYNKSKAAEVLGIDRATLYRKAQRYGIDLRGKVGSALD